MKKLLLLLFLMSISLGQSQTLEGTWKMTSLGVGPSKGNTSWYGLSVNSGERACLFDDKYVFGADGTFSTIQDSATYREGWLGDGCGTPTAPFNGSNPAVFTTNESSVTITGTGAYIGLPKVINGSEISSTEAHPGTVTYLITSLNTTTLTLDINVGGGWWRFVLAKEGVTPPPSNALKITTTVCGASPNSVVRMVGPWWNGWDSTAGPLAVNNGDETWTFTFDPAPTANMEYLILKDGVQENLIGKGACAAITDGSSYANRQWAVGSGNINNVYNSCSDCVNYPTTDAPTPIARNAWDVRSVYSSVYTNYSDVSFFPNWGQSTTFSNYTPVNDETLKYSNLTYQGIDLSGSKNVSAMTKLHIDVWTPEIKSFKISLIAGGENAVTLTPTLHGWNSFDIDLATQYAGRNLTDATQLKLERVEGGTSSLYLDNIYFYRPATSQPPTLGNFTVPTKVVGDANFDLTAPTSTSAGAFTYTSSNADVATISGSTVTIVGPGTSTITAIQAADTDYAEISVTASLDVSLASAAPTPTVPSDKVLSIFSGAPGYSDVANTQWRPNWGQSTQYNLVNVVGNPTIKYSNLSIEGVQLASQLDVTSYNNLHIDIYGAGTTAVNFSVMNQVGGAGSSDLEHIANTPLTLTPGIWNSFDIPLSSLTGLELNRIGQFKFDGSGTIYIDNIYFSKSTASHTTAPTVANISYCKGATALPLTAIASGTNSLKWYSTLTSTTALTTTPKPVTTSVGTKNYYVAQVMSDGFISPRATITVTILDLPTEVIAPITDSTADTTTGIYAVATKAVGLYVGSQTTVSYRVPQFSAGLSYYWTVPAGVSIVGQAEGVTSVTQEGVNANILNVNFSKVSSGIGTVGSITVQAQNAGGCKTTAKSSVALTKALPTAPTAIKMTDDSVRVAEGKSPEAITSFAKYMGTNTVLTLTATPSLTATSYVWELPEGVTQLSGGTSNVITVNFAGVTNSNTANYVDAKGISTYALRIGVKSVNGVGNSITANTALLNPTTTSTAKLLTLTAVAPAAPASLKMTEGISTTAVTNISTYIGKTTELTLTAAVSPLATSYVWELPSEVTLISGGSSNVITINFANVSSGTTSLYLGVKAVNGIGSSVKVNASTLVPSTSSTATLLKVTANAPAAVGIITGSLAICSTTASSVTYTITAIAKDANKYNITAPTGCTITNGIANTATIAATAGATFTVNYPSGFIANKTLVKTITIQSQNGFGVNTVANKVLTLTNIGAVCTPAIGNSRLTQKVINEDFNVIAYPNPSASVFTLEVQSSGKATTEVQVYDMTGRLIEQRQVESNSIEFGDNYSSGVYNVIVNQGDNTKTLRVIKQ